jgi:hydroxypyruvate reductase/glycerate 2-kinase
MYESGRFTRLMVLAAGKAASVMAAALEESLGDIISGGVVITKYGHLLEHPTDKLRLFEAGHPVPDEKGMKATREALAMLEGADEGTLVVCLLSGGGSALLVAPAEGISLAEKRELTNALLRAGATIAEMNAVRKHVSAVKGGRLARAAHPAGVVSLIVSDVIGDSLDVIASGPTAPDGSTYLEAQEVIEKYGIEPPESIRRLLARGMKGEVPDSPKAGDEAFGRVENIIIGSNRLALTAARERAEALGFPARVLTDRLTGEASEAAGWLLRQTREKTERPYCLVSGGETTVTVRGTGTGGRNMELALAFAVQARGESGLTLLSAGTDGTDGPTDAAGAIVDGSTFDTARALGLDPEESLRDNDSYHFFKRAGGLLVTGPTGTNVMDIQVVLLA